MTSPTSRSLAWLRERGFIAQVVEKWQPQSRRRIDLFGFVDIVALKPTGGLLFIQVTSSSNLAARVTKAQEECPQPLAGLLGTPGAVVEFHGWAKRGPRGKRKTWTLRRVDHEGMEIP